MKHGSVSLSIVLSVSVSGVVTACVGSSNNGSPESSADDAGSGQDGTILGRACIPGAQVACTCPGGAIGAQVCAPDGQSLGACQGCGPVDSAAPLDSNLDDSPSSLVDGSVADGSIDALDNDGPETGPVEASNNTATIVGVVLDYTQGAGKGVVPSATLSVINGPTVTAGADGTFTIPGLTPGRVQINVGHPVVSPFAGTSQTVYSTTQITGAAAQPTGELFAVSTTPAQASGTGAACETNAAACTSVGVIAMENPNVACASGTVQEFDSSAPVTYDVRLTETLTNGQQNAGMLPYAYIGTATASATGQLCAPVPPGSAFTLLDPAVATNCPGGSSPPSPVSVPGDAGAGACASAAACFDAGDIFYGCYGL